MSVRITRKKPIITTYSADLEHLRETVETAKALGAPMESASAGATASGR